MSSEGPRTGPARDVPRPRPVTDPGDPAQPDGGGLGRAARSLADAVAGLLGERDDPAGTPGTPGDSGAPWTPDDAGRGSRAARTLRDVDWNPGTVLTDLLRTAAPRLPIRDRKRIRAAHPGRTDTQIAEHLVARAARLTAGIGAATGGLTAAQWFAPPAMLALPLELGAETVLVAAVEVVLIGELHELYGRPAQGEPGARAGAYLTSWTAQRAVDGGAGQGGLLATIGSAGVNALRRRVTRRLARNLSSTAPLLLGATLAARSNRQATTQLAEQVLGDLRTALPGRSGPPTDR